MITAERCEKVLVQIKCGLIEQKQEEKR